MICGCGSIPHEFLRGLYHICNLKIHLGGDFHDLVLTCTLQKKAHLSLLDLAVWRCPTRGTLRGLFVMPMLRNILLSQSCLPEVWLDIRCQLTVYLHLYIWVSVCSWQMASVSHLYSCLFTDELVSNVFSVAFRSSVMMIHSYVWEKICIYFCTKKI